MRSAPYNLKYPSMPKTLIAIATGQNQSNLVVISHLIEKKILKHSDQVLWLRTPFIRSKRVPNASNQKAININHVMIDIEDEDLFNAKRLSLKLQKFKIDGHELIICANGGQKPHLLTLKEIFPQATYYYSEANKVEIYSLSSKGREKEAIKGNISLDMILTEHQRAIKPNSDNLLIFKHQFLNQQNLTCPSEEYETFIQNSDFQNGLLKLYGPEIAYKPIDFPKYEDLYRAFSSSFESDWKGYVNTFNKKLPKAKQFTDDQKNQLTDLTKSPSLLTQSIGFYKNKVEKFYNNNRNTTLNNKEFEILKTFNWVSSSKKLKGEYHKILPNNRTTEKRLGSFFEECVAYRLIQFLNERQHFQNVISEIWFNVKILNPLANASSENVDAELDICIVLKNGILVPIECKTYDTTDEKDFNSRINKLKQAGGLYGRYYVCLPFFPHVERKIFEQHLNLYKKLTLDMNLQVIAFTEQTFSGYNIEISNPGASNKSLAVLSFEKNLTGILNAFL